MKKHTEIMWALPWLSFDNVNRPSVYEAGAWLICFNRSQALDRAAIKGHTPVKVLVTITEPPKRRKGKPS